MKTILLFVTAIILSLPVFAEEFALMPEGIYLDVEETGVEPWSGTVPVRKMTPVTDRADAEVKLPAVLAEHFAGKSYEARLHYHYLDKPCTWELIATGTQP